MSNAEIFMTLNGLSIVAMRSSLHACIIFELASFSASLSISLRYRDARVSALELFEYRSLTQARP